MKRIPLILWALALLAFAVACDLSDEDSSVTNPGIPPALLVQVSARAVGDGSHVAISSTTYGGQAPYLYSLTTGDGGRYEVEGATLDITHAYASCGDLDGWPVHVTVTELASRAQAADDTQAMPCQGEP